MSAVQHRPPREVIEIPWQEANSVVQLLESDEPAVLWLGLPVDPPPSVDLLFPELASAEVRTHHFYKPTGRARLGLGGLSQVVVSGPSLVGSPTQLYLLGSMTAAYVDDWLRDDMPIGDRDLVGRTERSIPGISVLLTHWNIATYGHWLLEGLPKLLLIRRLIDELPPFQILLPRSAPGFIRDWIELVLPNPPVAVYDDATEYVRVERLVVPTVPFVSRGHHFHPDAASLFDDVLPAGRGRHATRIYVSRVEPNHLRELSNRAEIEAIATAEGLEVVRPETMPIAEQIALFARAEIIVGDFGSAMHNALFTPPGALVLCLNMVTGLQSRIAELRRHRVGYLLPSGGEAVIPQPDSPKLFYEIDPEQFRAYVRACHAIVRGDDPAPDGLAASARPGADPPEQSPVTAATTGWQTVATPLTRFFRRGTKVVWWTVTLQLPRRLRDYRAYRSARTRSE